MLAALGLFVFDTSSTLFETIDRDREWRHERSDRFGARAASQFVGPGADKLVLSGMLVPELVGSWSAIETLAQMADEGEAYPLADGAGNIVGTFTIDRISERKGNLIDTGVARRNEFTIELTRVA